MRLMIPELRKAHPALSVELRGAYQRADLIKGEADVAVRMARPDEGGLVAVRAFECAWCVYASASYLQAHGRPTTFEQLAEHRLVLYAEQLHSAPPARWLEAYKGGAAVVSRLDSLETVCQAIVENAGIATLPAFVADSVPELQRVFPDCVATNTGWVVYHENLRDTPRIRTVVDALLAFFRAHEASFTGVSRRDGERAGSDATAPSKVAKQSAAKQKTAKPRPKTAP
jgi:DNA-binding transcriptional LysR family regulator